MPQSNLHVNFQKPTPTFLGNTIVTSVINARGPAHLHTKSFYFTLPGKPLKSGSREFPRDSP